MTHGAVRTAPASLVGQDVIQALKAEASRAPPGCFVEVGVYHGGTAWHLAEIAEGQGRPVYLYDTFAGIPHQAACDSHKLGDFNDTSAELVRHCIPYAHVIEGVFPQSAVAMEPVAFVHLDCDQEQSYREALNYLHPLIVPGGVIWCDDVPCLPGALQAVSEFCRRTGHRLEQLGGEAGHKSVIRF